MALLKLCVRSLMGILAMFVLISSLFGQGTQTYSGTIIDYASNEPISGVSVSLIIDGNQIGDPIGTDFNGRFSFRAPSTSSIELVFTHPRHLRKTKEVTGSVNDLGNIRMVRAQSIQLSGRVVDAQTNRGLELASVLIISNIQEIDLGRPIGVTTGSSGNFDFTFNFTLPFTIRVAHVGHHTQDVQVTSRNVSNVEVRLQPQILEGEAIVVTSSLVAREEMRSTITIERIGTVDIQQVASFDAFDLISTLREVDVSTQSMNMQSVSTRGFNTGANARFMQTTDGADSQAPGLGFPVGNLLGPPEVDISGMELIVGPASTRYGSNAMNGVLEIRSRDPFLDQGLSLNYKAGVNDLKLGGATQWAAEGDLLHDISARYAQVIGDRFAFKFTGSLLEGIDWRANNYNNIGPGLRNDRHDKNPGYDGVNVYGDEAYVLLPVGLDALDRPDGSYVPVTRTGYREEDLVNYDIATRKASASLHYKITPETILTLDGRYGYTNTLYTADSRIRLEDFRMMQFKAELVSGDFFARAYTTAQFSGNSYDVVYLASNLQRSAKSDADWYRDFSMIYKNGFSAAGIPANNIILARRFADGPNTFLPNREVQARFEPGTEEFDAEVQRLKTTYDFNDGAGIRDNSILYNADAGHTFRGVFGELDIDVGGNFRFYDLDSGGTIFPDTSSNNITNYQYGIYASTQNSYLDESLSLSFALRADKNENFAARLSPQMSAGFVINDEHFLRFSYQYGFRYPTVREQFLNQNLGNARLMGGLSEITSQYNLQNNSVTLQALEEYNRAVAYDITDAGFRNVDIYNQTQAEINNLHILQNGIIGPNQLGQIKTEKVHAFEVGYRKLFTPLLYLDLNYFVSFYSDMIGITRIVRPQTSPSVDLFTAAGQMNSTLESERFFVFSNASDLITMQGFSLDLKYQSGGFFAGFNGTYTGLIQASDDPISPGFNTPPYKFNIEWGNRAISENAGFKMIYRYRSGFDWVSPFLDGPIDQYGHMDIQINFRIPAISSMLKTGITNFGISRYYNNFGGPQIGSIIFATLTYNPRMF